jgi:Vitamin K-dependent gamma-carboxylase/Lipase maturation factor/DCC1-like thiol-disulfide oxidoreductase
MGLSKQIFKTGWGTKLEELFGLDLRSLAIFRIGLALLILVDLIQRYKNLTAHYTDFGILPRGALIEEFSNPWRWSIHLFNGEPFFQSILFLLAGLVALALLVGYQTRFVTIFSWALLVSLYNRNNLIITAGDIELRLLLFWSMFLPLGACYSVDSALNSSSKPLPQRILTGATIALILQVCFVYWFTGLLKSDPVWWKEGTAVYYALNLDYMATPFTQFLLNFPPFVLKFITFATLWFELLGPFLIFIPFRTSFFRCCAVVLFILLHVGFRVGLMIGLFPYVCIVSWFAFLPSGLWNWISQRLQNPQRQGVRIYYDSECDFCQKTVHLIRTFWILPGTPLLPAQEEPEIFAQMKVKNSWVVVDWQGDKHFKFEAIVYLSTLSPLFQYLAPILKWQPLMLMGTKFYQILAKNRRTASKFTTHLRFRPLKIRVSLVQNIAIVFFLVCALSWNLYSIAPNIFKIPTFIYRPSVALALDQSWKMFAPYPAKNDGWYVIPGQLKDGTEIDVFKDGKPVSWEKPPLVSANYPDMYWIKYFEKIWRPEHQKHRVHYGRYLCRNWNSQHQGEKQLDRFEIYFMLERTPPNYQPPKVEKVLIGKHNCFK